MINYFGIGMDGMIGAGFEKKRTGIRCCNKFVYVTEGVKRFFGCCCRPMPLVKQIEYLRTLKHENMPNHQGEPLHTEPTHDTTALNQHLIHKNGQDGILFHTDKTYKTNYYLKPDPVCIMATNIQSLMGGRANLWKNSKDKFGLVNTHGKPLPKEHLPMYQTQVFNDGILEFSSFDYILDLGLGRSSKVA